MLKPPIPTLSIPCEPTSRTPSASPLAQSPSAQTGRPSMWTESDHRQLVRLYVYTKLPVRKIRDIIYRNAAGGPGSDSATKTLNGLLDKQPRWMRPRNTEDMGRRIDQLSQSPTRLSAPDNSPTAQRRPFPAQKRSVPDFSPEMQHHINVKEEGGVSPILLEVPEGRWGRGASVSAPSPVAGTWDWTATSQTRSPTACSSDSSTSTKSIRDENRDEAVFRDFLHRTTIMSSSTDDTTGSMQSILAGQTKTYIRVIKRLVRRFTHPKRGQGNSSTTPDSASAVIDWLADEEAPQAFEQSPYPLPGDFLCVNNHVPSSACRPDTTHHAKGRCLCAASEDIQWSPWVTRHGLTEAGNRIFSRGPDQCDWTQRDSFNNSVLHFMSARGTVEQLCHVMAIGVPPALLNQVNSAGETFLHVARPDFAHNVATFCDILSRAKQLGLNLFARDHYGRTIFHMVRAMNISMEEMVQIQNTFHDNRYDQRDAFGVRPAMALNEATSRASLAAGPMAMDESDCAGSTGPSHKDAILAEKKFWQRHFLEKVKCSLENPSYEDENGRNGLHCLAFAASGMTSAAEELPLGPSRHSHQYQGKQRGTSEKSLKIIARKLLAAGTDPNHYDCDGNTPLMSFAAQLPEGGDYKTGPELLTMLLSERANVDARNRAGETALHIAARCGRKLAVKALVDGKARVNTRDAMGRSILEVIDAKIIALDGCSTKDFVRFEACRAWLSGVAGQALQDPSVIDEWGSKEVKE